MVYKEKNEEVFIIIIILLKCAFLTVNYKLDLRIFYALKKINKIEYLIKNILMSTY